MHNLLHSIVVISPVPSSSLSDDVVSTKCSIVVLLIPVPSGSCSSSGDPASKKWCIAVISFPVPFEFLFSFRLSGFEDFLCRCRLSGVSLFLGYANANDPLLSICERLVGYTGSAFDIGADFLWFSSWVHGHSDEPPSIWSNGHKLGNNMIAILLNGLQEWWNHVKCWFQFIEICCQIQWSTK